MLGGSTCHRSITKIENAIGRYTVLAVITVRSAYIFILSPDQTKSGPPHIRYSAKMDGGLQTWALPRIRRLLPLDDLSLVDLLTYTTSLSKHEGAEHLKNLLGDSPAALEFISSFNNRRPEVSPSNATSLPVNDDDAPKTRRPVSKKTKPTLHSAGPARRPEGYGDVAGG